MNSLSPQNGNGITPEKHVVDQINADILSLNQRLDVDEATIADNTEDISYAIGKNTVQDSRLDALESKTDYTMNRLDVDTISGGTISADVLTTHSFQTDTISSDNLNLTGDLNVSVANIPTINTHKINLDEGAVIGGDYDHGWIMVKDVMSFRDKTDYLSVLHDSHLYDVYGKTITLTDSIFSPETRTNKIISADSTTGTTNLTSIKFRNEQPLTNLPNAFRFIKIPIIQNGYYGIEYINNAAADDKENFSIMVYQNNGTVMVSYSQNDINTIHKFYYDSLNKNLWVETTNDIDTGLVKWSSADTETHNLAEFYGDITIDITQKEVYGKLATRLHGWLFMGDHTVSYGMDIMGHLTADLITPDKMITPFQRFYPEGTPIEAIYKDLIGNIGLGRFETSGYYGTALNKVEALNRLKVEENKITWTIDTDYGWDNIVWENWGQTETIPYDIGVITTSNVWDRAVNDPFEPTIITLTIHNSVDGTITTNVGYGFITLTDIPETGYALQGYATEVDGSVVYNIGDKLTEDTELWTVYEPVIGYIYNSEEDPNYDTTDMASPYWNGIDVLHFDNVVEAVCPAETTTQKITFTVETDAELTNYSGAYWLNGYCVGHYDPAYDDNIPGSENAYATQVEDGVYEIYWQIDWNGCTPGETYPIAGFGAWDGTYFGAFGTLCTNGNIGTYFKVRDNWRIEDI